jgi:hypothetical protein
VIKTSILFKLHILPKPLIFILVESAKTITFSSYINHGDLKVLQGLMYLKSRCIPSVPKTTCYKAGLISTPWLDSTAETELFRMSPPTEW